MADQLELVQPWRKAFPLARPPIPGDKADAQRFVNDLEEATEEVDVGQQYTAGDVLKGLHRGGLAAGAPAMPGVGAAGYAQAVRERDKRRQKTMVIITKYVGEPTLVATLRAEPHAEAAWARYRTRRRS